MLVSSVKVNSAVQFKNSENKENKTKNFSYTFKNHTVTKEDLKEPLEVAKSIGLTAILTYATVYCAAEVAFFKFAPRAGVNLESYLKNISQKTKAFSKNLGKDKSKGIIPSIKRKTAKVISFFEEKSRKTYKSISNWGLTKTSDDEERATKSLSNLVGIGAVIINLYNKCTKDTDGNGVKDIFQSKFG